MNAESHNAENVSLGGCMACGGHGYIDEPANPCDCCAEPRAEIVVPAHTHPDVHHQAACPMCNYGMTVPELSQAYVASKGGVS